MRRRGRGAGIEGELQVASFHPDYRFAGTPAQDITNYTTRSPYPMLQVLRGCQRGARGSEL